MILHWIDIACVMGMIAAGNGIIYFFLLRRFERALAASQRDMEHRLAALTEQIRRQPRPDEAVETANELESTDTKEILREDAQYASHPDELRASGQAQSSQQSFAGEEDEIPPEIRVAITAAAIATFGNHARIRAARRVPSTDVVSPWTQQGRVIVQSSHNLRTRR